MGGHRGILSPKISVTYCIYIPHLNQQYQTMSGVEMPLVTVTNFHQSLFHISVVATGCDRLFNFVTWAIGPL